MAMCPLYSLEQVPEVLHAAVRVLDDIVDIVTRVDRPSRRGVTACWPGRPNLAQTPKLLAGHGRGAVRLRGCGTRVEETMHAVT